MVKLAAERNPADITTTDIANAISVTQGALFRHFPTKEAIRLAVVEWIEEQLMAELHGAQRGASDPLGALRAMFMAHVVFTRNYPGVPRLIFAELQQPDTSPVRQRVQHLMHGYRTTVIASLTEAAGAQQIRDDVDYPSAAALFLGAIQGLVIQSMLGGSAAQTAAQIEQRAEGVLAIYLAGLGAAS